MGQGLKIRSALCKLRFHETEVTFYTADGWQLFFCAAEYQPLYAGWPNKDSNW